jgi:hypothetical protein
MHATLQPTGTVSFELILECMKHRGTMSSVIRKTDIALRNFSCAFAARCHAQPLKWQCWMDIEKGWTRTTRTHTIQQNPTCIKSRGMAAPRPIPSSEHGLASNRGTTGWLPVLHGFLFPLGIYPQKCGHQGTVILWVREVDRLQTDLLPANRTIETLAAQQQTATVGVLGNPQLDKSSQCEPSNMYRTQTHPLQAHLKC